MMAKEDGPGSRPNASQLEEGVPSLARRGLRRLGSKRGSPLLAVQTQSAGQLRNTMRNQCAFVVNPMIEVGHNELEPMQIGRATQQVEERDRIRTARHGDKRAAGRKRQCGE